MRRLASVLLSLTLLSVSLTAVLQLIAEDGKLVDFGSISSPLLLNGLVHSGWEGCLESIKLMEELVEQGALGV